MSTFTRDTESLSMSALSVVLIGPDEQRRRLVAKALAGPQAKIARVVERYPEVGDLAEIIEADYDVVIVDLDPDPELALDVVEALCGQNNSITVMVYSARGDSELLVRCMRAGVREFLTEPVLPGTVGEALVRASVRRDEVRRHKKATGKLLVFVGAKGGSGADYGGEQLCGRPGERQSGAKVALLDLDLQLGDAALTLGVATKFTALDALENMNRLDSDFLSVLMAKHASGLAVLGAPDTIPAIQPSKNGMEKLFRVVREDFEYVVVDAGSHSIEMYEALFETASTVYLVAQVAVADLRNSNRFIVAILQRLRERKAGGGSEPVHCAGYRDRRGSHNQGFDTACKMENPQRLCSGPESTKSGVPLVSEKSQIAYAFAEMATVASGRSTLPGKKKKFSLFG